MLCHTFANATHISRPKFDEQIMKREKKNSIAPALLICMTTLNIIFKIQHTLIVNQLLILLSPTLNVNLTLFVIPCKLFWGITDLQCCNYCHLPSNFSSKLQSSMTIFHHKLLTREVRVLVNG